MNETIKRCQDEAYDVFNNNLLIQNQIFRSSCFKNPSSTTTPVISTVSTSTTTPVTTTPTDCSEILNSISMNINSISANFDSELLVSTTAEAQLYGTDLSVQNLIATFEINASCQTIVDKLVSPILAHNLFLKCVANVKTDKIAAVTNIFGILAQNVPLISSCQLPVSFCSLITFVSLKKPKLYILMFDRTWIMI